MVEDFTNQTGQFEGKAKRYDAYDLEFGIGYAEGLIEDGFKVEPFYQFNLNKFIAWCKNKLVKERR
jgi:hypothetical protein